MKPSASQSNLPFNGHPNGCHDGVVAVQFGCSAQELSELLEIDRQEAACRIRERYGGVGEICRYLKTSPTKGLSGSLTDLEIRTRTFGSNASASVRTSQNFLPLLRNAIWDVTLGVLMATVVVSFALSFLPKESSTDFEIEEETDSTSDWIEFVVLFVIILLIVLAVALIELLKQQWMRTAGAEHIRKCTVIRGGEYVEISTDDIVVGDICDISYGNIVPASGCLVRGFGVRVKEAFPDGTVHVVAKDVLGDPLVHCGSHVVSGSGRIVITKVGSNSDFLKKLSLSFDQRTQKTATKVQDSQQCVEQLPKLSSLEEADSDIAFHLKRKSTLESKIRRLTIQLCYAGIAGTVLLIGALIVQLALNAFVIEKKTSAVDFVQDLMRCLLLAATVVIVIVPVRLPAGLVLVFAQTLKRMLREGNLVHHIGALENVGYVTDVITNKTGAITKNRTSVVQFFLGGHIYKDPSTYHKIPAGVCSLITRLVSLSTEYSAEVEETSEKRSHRGDSRDRALLKFVLDLHQNYKVVRELMPYDHFIWICPFGSTRKFNFTVVPYESGGYQLLAKGAADVLLSRCKWFIDGETNIHPLTVNNMENIVLNVLQPMSAAGLSTICLAFKNYVSDVSKEYEECSSPEPNWENEENIVSDLTFVAIFGVEDPIREEILKSVEKCHKFGVAVRLVTGEAIEAAESVATKCSIIDDRNKFEVLEGKALEAHIRRMPNGPIVPEYFDSIWSKLGVVARSSPENRFTIVHSVSEFLTKTRCSVIACTGIDSTDVASLRKADVGFSMRNVGSDITREASDIVLQNDSFSGIVRCIVWSRCIQENIRKLLQFQLTSIATTFFTVMIGVCVFKESPLQPTHLLWIKIILDLLAAATLTSEWPMEKFVDCRPYTKLESLFTRSVGKNVIFHSLYQIIVVLILFFAGEYFINMEDDYGHKYLKMSPKYTTIFNTCILMILFNEINARMLNGERNVFYQICFNYPFAGTWIGSFIVQIFIVHFGGSVFSTVALTLEQWGWCLFFGVGELLWSQVIAFLPKCDICEKTPICRNDVQEVEKNKNTLWEIENDDTFDDSHLGMILWKHGLTRLQNQLRVAHAFRNILENSTEIPSGRGSQRDLDLSSLSLPKHLQAFSTHNCFYPQLHPRDRPENQLPNFKSKSADDVLFDSWISEPTGNLSDQMALPKPLKARNDPYLVFPR